MQTWVSSPVIACQQAWRHGGRCLLGAMSIFLGIHCLSPLPNAVASNLLYKVFLDVESIQYSLVPPSLPCSLILSALYTQELIFCVFAPSFFPLAPCPHATCGVFNAYPSVSAFILVIIQLCHGSIALPMLGVPKMSMGVSEPHFTSPSSNGSQIGCFTSALALTLIKKISWGALALTPEKKNNKKYVCILFDCPASTLA